MVAHEWGHAIQARLDSSLVAQAEELQADCLGAAALYGAAADGNLEFDAGDEQELVTSLSALADQMPWTMTSDHGDAFQRVQWFTLGRNGGVNACHDVLVDPSASTVPHLDRGPRRPRRSRHRPEDQRPPARSGLPADTRPDRPRDRAGSAWHPRSPRSVVPGQPGRTTGRPEAGATALAPALISRSTAGTGDCAS